MAMDVSLWAFAKLACADAGERSRAVERYRLALGLSEADAAGLLPEVLKGEALGPAPSASLEERVALLEILADSARADESTFETERTLLVALAEQLRIPPVACANAMVGRSSESSADGSRRRGRRVSRRLLRNVLLVAALLAVAGYAAQKWLDHSERQELFAGVEHQHDASVLLVVVDYALILGVSPVEQRAIGTGFFVADGGLLVTNKHVIEPWKFDPEIVRKLDDGYVLDPESVRVRAWRSGDVRFGMGGKIDGNRAFDTGEGSLEVAWMPADRMTERALALQEGGVHRSLYHVLDDTDLALLRTAPRARRERPLPLSSREPLEGESVVVVGFRDGPELREERRARVTATTGVLDRSKGRPRLRASIPSGSSGGPVLDTSGEVLGIATERLGNADGTRFIPARALEQAIRASQGDRKP